MLLHPTSQVSMLILLRRPLRYGVAAANATKIDKPSQARQDTYYSPQSRIPIFCQLRYIHIERPLPQHRRLPETPWFRPPTADWGSGEVLCFFPGDIICEAL